MISSGIGIESQGCFCLLLITSWMKVVAHAGRLGQGCSTQRLPICSEAVPLMSNIRCLVCDMYDGQCLPFNAGPYDSRFPSVQSHPSINRSHLKPYQIAPQTKVMHPIR